MRQLGLIGEYASCARISKRVRQRECYSQALDRSIFIVLALGLALWVYFANPRMISRLLLPLSCSKSAAVQGFYFLSALNPAISGPTLELWAGFPISAGTATTWIPSTRLPRTLPSRSRLQETIYLSKPRQRSFIQVGMHLLFTTSEPDQLRILGAWLPELSGGGTEREEQPNILLSRESAKSTDFELQGLRKIASELVALLNGKTAWTIRRGALLQRLAKQLNSEKRQS
jgi:hypothetical protein